MSEAHAHVDDKKSSIGEKAWGLVGTAIAVLLAVIALIFILQALLPMVFSGGNGIFASFNLWLRDFGQEIGNFHSSLSNVMMKIGRVMFTLLLWFFMFLIGAFGVKMAIKKWNE